MFIIQVVALTLKLINLKVYIVMVSFALKLTFLVHISTYLLFRQQKY